MSNEMSREQMLALIAKMEQDNSLLKAKLVKANKPKAMTIRVSQKGAVSVYGLGRFPVTLYRSQWERLLSAKEEIVEFIEANADSLASRDDE